MYDRSGRLITLTGYTSGTTGSQNTVYAYNKSGLQTRVIYPDDDPGSGDRGYVDYSYDAVQRLTRLNHQDNTDTDIVYDSMGRRLTITKGTEIDSYTYTASGSLATAKRGTTGTPGLVSSVTRSYDGLMNLTREAQSVKQSAARNVDYAYDKNSNILTLTYPNGSAIENTLDSLGRASTVKRSGSTLASYTYVGYQLKTQTYETGVNNVTLTATYDGASGGRLTRLAYSQTGNTTLPDFSYNYTAGGDITRKTFNDIAGTPSEDYQYDTLHRLTHTTFSQRTSAPYEGFVYDNLDNHLTQDDNGTTTAGLFNAVNEQTKRGTIEVLYDRRGNLTKDDTPTPGRAYLYNRQNMLTRVEDASSNLIASYAYDALNRRIEKTVTGSPDVTTRFYYTADWQLIEETDATATVQRYYIWAQGNASGGAGYIDDLLLMRDVIGTSGTANTDYFACRHHNFNVVAMLDNTGAVVERYDDNPYGKRFILDPDYTADADGISDVGLNIGHQGLMSDGESELVYNRSRMLNPTLGRWMQRDVLQYIDGMSMYNYLDANPLMRIDPTGGAASINPATVGAIIEAGITAKELSQMLQISVAAATTMLAAHASSKAINNIVKNLQKTAKGKDPCETAKDAVNKAKKALDSFKQLIADHEGWIKNPSSYPGGLKPPYNQHKDRLIKKWKGDIRRARTNIKHHKKVLKILEKLADDACPPWYKFWR